MSSTAGALHVLPFLTESVPRDRESEVLLFHFSLEQIEATAAVAKALRVDHRLKTACEVLDIV